MKHPPPLHLALVAKWSTKIKKIKMTKKQKTKTELKIK